MFEVLLLFYILIYERNNQKFFFDFCSVLTKISQKSFLGICHVPSVITLAKVVQIGLE
jgi:hypothetical protein